MLVFAAPLMATAEPASPAVEIIAEILRVGGSLSLTERSALRNYINTLVNKRIWGKRILLYGIMGGTNNSHALNWAYLGNNILTYQGETPTSSVQGIKFNGGWAETDYFASAGNFAISGYSKDNDINLGTIDIGAAAPRFYGGLTPTVAYNAINSTLENDTTLSKSKKHVIAQRTSSTTLKTYVDGTLIDTFINTAVSASSEILIASLRYGGTPSYPQNPNSVCQHYGIWQALTDLEAADLYAAEVTLQTALNRA
jgi:hypothetical protein